jgi:hypothetical protein
MAKIYVSLFSPISLFYALYLAASIIHQTYRMAAMMPGMTKNQVAAHAAKKQKRGLQVKCGLELTGPILEKNITNCGNYISA